MIVREVDVDTNIADNRCVSVRCPSKERPGLEVSSFADSLQLNKSFHKRVIATLALVC
jgi:hypothetical protein